MSRLRFSCLLALSICFPFSSATAQSSNAFTKAVSQLPDSETAVSLFNGKDLTGWVGDESRWSVVDGMIRGANNDNVPSSTYLFTDKNYRNFRLLLEVKQTVGKGYSTMHSAVSALGKRFADKGDNAFGFKGPLLMFCHDWGIWDAYRRNRVVDRGAGPDAENKGDWNLIEILVIGNQIRFVANGTEVFDFTDKPKMLQESPIGLQLHSNGKPQEYHFRGLVLAENPEDRLVSKRPVWKQVAEVQPSIERGADTTAGEEISDPKFQISDGDFSNGPNPKWIWGEDNSRNYTIKTTFETSQVKAAKLMASCDNVGTVFVNGKQVASGSEWSEAMSADVAKHLVDGKNEVSALVENQGGVAAFVLKLVIQTEDGEFTHVVSDENWTISTKNLDDGRKVAVRANYGDRPWGRVFDNVAAEGRVPRGTFEVLPGFQVEKLFTVPKDELGSWVCIAFDNKGRLIASDQGNKGICRITLPKIGSENGAAANGETIVEHLDFSGCEYQPSGAQGMLWAFDSLYFCCNGGPGSGLYRARDTDGDDQFDECVRLKEFRGGGEHGPHSLRLSPDGKRIFVIAGNHTAPPFKAGEELENHNYSSRLPTNWSEDLLLPRMWDANGHARGKLAPGGWIASTDPDGKTWDIWSVGFRNPYDMAFNADGELFAYDADMEWDVGTPWYRPTRVVHATSGSEFGWRSGTGKWPTYYYDSLPTMVNIGPGSPVGVDFGYGPPLAADSEAALKAPATVPSGLDGYVYAPLLFPAKYQKALYCCDWTFGTMYAVHTMPDQSSYTATKEEFVARSPLPLTDCAAGPDGALYFTIGGRGAQSELFRVVYTGNESTVPTQLKNEAFAEARKKRNSLQDFHRQPADYDQQKLTDFITEGADIFDSEDRFLRTATRNAFFNSNLTDELFGTVAELEKLSADLTDVSYSDIGAAFLIAKLPMRVMQTNGTSKESIDQWKSAARTTCHKILVNADFGKLTTDQQLYYLRTVSLVATRLGEISDRRKSALAARLDAHYPAADWRINRELCQMLVYLNSSSVVSKTVDLMNAPPTREDIEMGDLLTRNAGYARDIKAMMANQPDKQQMWYAFCLRVAETGWTPELRADYYRWFGRAQAWSGGNSFKKFLQNIEDEAWQKTPFDHRVLVEKVGARTPYTVPELPKPVGPGKKWTIEEVRSLAADGLKNRNFANGKKMFAATRCIVCHRFNGDGGATGPDLTQLAGRFNNDALTEAIMEPSKVISDQYKASTVVTTAGKTIVGRIVSETDRQVSVLTDPEDSTKIVDIPRNEVDEILASTVSIMPAKLLDQLNQDEVLDLLAYLLSRGDEKNGMFRK